jgi:hypothetical protein
MKPSVIVLLSGEIPVLNENGKTVIGISRETWTLDFREKPFRPGSIQNTKTNREQNVLYTFQTI